MDLTAFKCINENYPDLQRRFQALCQPALKFFKAKQFCFNHVTDDGKNWALNTHPDLWKFYIDSNGLKDDPYIKQPKLFESLTSVWTTERADSSQDPVSFGFREQFGIYHGVAVVDRTYYGMGFAFGSGDDSLEMVNRIVNHPLKVRAFIDHLVNGLQEAIQKFKDNAFDLVAYKGDSFFQLDEEETLREASEAAQFLLSTNQMSEADLWLKDVTFGARQKECLEYYCQGYTTADIARKLGLSQNSVSGYFLKIKRRLGVTKKRDFLHKLYLLQQMGILSEGKQATLWE